MSELTESDEREIWLIACARGIDVGRARVIYEAQKLSEQVEAYRKRKLEEEAKERAIREALTQKEAEIEAIENELEEAQEDTEITCEALKHKEIELQTDKREFIRVTNEAVDKYKVTLEETLRNEATQQIEAEKTRLNSQKAKIDLIYTKKISANLGEYEKVLTEVLETLSSGKFNNLTLRFLNTANKGIQLVISSE